MAARFFSKVPFKNIAAMLRTYLGKREGNESFHTLCNRNSVDTLQEIFSL